MKRVRQNPPILSAKYSEIVAQHRAQLAKPKRVSKATLEAIEADMKTLMARTKPDKRARLLRMAQTLIEMAQQLEDMADEL